MSSRRYLIAVACIVLAGAGARHWLDRPHPIDPSKPHALRAYERIRLGMWRYRVAAVMEADPGDYCTYEAGVGPIPAGRPVHAAGLIHRAPGLCGASGCQPLPPGATVERWNWRDWWVWITFDKYGKVIGTELLEVTWHP